MRRKWFLLVLTVVGFREPTAGFAEIDSSTKYTLGLTNPEAVPKQVQWSAPDYFAVTPDGLGWGDGDDEGSREFWLQTEPMGIGLSWRPTSSASVKAQVEGAETPGSLYVRYSADKENWTTWQPLQRIETAQAVPETFQGTLCVPSREQTRYHQRRLDYARRDDVPWCSDEEAFVKELLQLEPGFFRQSTPFIGYVQFLYEAELSGGQRLTGLQIDVGWSLSCLHLPPKDAAAKKGRDGPCGSRRSEFSDHRIVGDRIKEPGVADAGLFWLSTIISRPETHSQYR